MHGLFRQYALLGVVIIISVGCMVAAIHTFLTISGPQEETPIFDNRGMFEPKADPAPPGGEPGLKWDTDRSADEDGLT
ncbi:hypothetical protein [Pontiella agarivorans]|uniref:Uncharacterized protein n=1 Tax=Pontiella agarivorans TaxID=3038953 RepID=A0ABU5MYM1_9BACT|nr:hypothetical protein [Pontiella agarivorans]MDZ8119287.1 hypothetical protein [Pontiella agarivorans]